MKHLRNYYCKWSKTTIYKDNKFMQTMQNKFKDLYVYSVPEGVVDNDFIATILS